MNWFSQLFRRRKFRSELDSELRFHIEQKAAQLIASGVEAGEARHRAMAKLGGMEAIKQGYRESRPAYFLETILQDIRYALRTLRKSPGFTIVAILTLALGIGANTAIFSVVDSVLIASLPYWEPQQLVRVYEVWRHEEDPIAPGDFLDIQRENHVFQGMAGYEGASFDVAARGGAERIDGAIVSANLFSVLGVRPVLGRGFRSNGERVAVLSDGFWKSAFGARRDVMGKTLVMNNQAFTIVGVMPPGFHFAGGAQLWVPSRFAVPERERSPDKDPSSLHGSHYFKTVARLKPGVTLAQARGDIETICQRLESEYPSSEGGNGVIILTLQEAMAGSGRTVILLLFGAVGLVLLIACANVANLQLAHTADRQREIAVRIALGAGRRRIALQFLTEGMVLSVLGGAAGLMVARAMLGPLSALVPRGMRSIAAPGIHGEVLAFSLLVSVIAGIIFTLAPALQDSNANLNEALKEGLRGGSEGRHRRQLRNVLVVAQVAIAFVLLVSAGLVVRSIGKLLAVKPGFDSQQVLTARLSLVQPKYTTSSQKVVFTEEVLAALDRLPGVLSASTVRRLPLIPGSSAESIWIEGRPWPSGQVPDVYDNVVSADYFQTMGIQVLGGRTFNKLDTPESPGVVVVNRSLARRFWGGHDALGQRISVNGPKGPWREIVGIVSDVKQHLLWQPPRPMLYLPYPQNPEPSMTLLIRSAYNPAALASEVQPAVASVDPSEPIYSVRTMNRVVAASLGPRRISTFLLGLFAFLAIVLASVGIYGVISYSVSQRVHEIGVRIALGAQKREVFRMVIGQGFRLALAGLAIGLAAALALTRTLSSFSQLLYGVPPNDPGTFVDVSLVLVAVATLACYIPARRAMRVDPVVALRQE